MNYLWGMNYRNLGKWGIKLSELSLGSWLTFGKQISDETAKDLMVTAYNEGVNFLTMPRFTLKAVPRRLWAMYLNKPVGAGIPT